jgi:acetyl/propionyl-CoA carboxylase alpha subunit
MGQAGAPRGPAAVRELRARVAGEEAAQATGWRLDWLDQARGLARLSDGRRSLIAHVEGSGTEWFVTLAGRRLGVTVETWRERMLAEARLAATVEDGPLEIRSTLPGLVVAVNVSVGSEVQEGDPLVTIEAMKMQNEVRAPRAGTIGQVAVSAGAAVAAGVLLLRLD